MKKIAVSNFFYPPVGEQGADLNLYESDLGFDRYDYDLAMALTPENVLRYMLDVLGYDIYFFYPCTMCWYLIDHCKGDGIRLMILPVGDGWDGRYIKDNYINESDDADVVVFRSDTVEEFIKGARIGGKTIGEVLDRSYIDNYC